MVETAPPQPLMTSRTLAQHLSVTRDTVRKWARAGVIPSIRLGHGYRFIRTEVEAALRAGSAQTAEEDSDAEKR